MNHTRHSQAQPRHERGAGRKRHHGRRAGAFIAVFGPGLVVMLADTDVGSIITAGQSGAAWGYRLLLVQFILVPILFLVQELTVRLGVVTGRGHGELIKEAFGPVWAWISVAGLAVATAGALLTELSGVAGIGELYGAPRAATLTAAAVGLILVVGAGAYRRVERIAIMLGLFELAFFIVAWAAKPNLAEMSAQMVQMPMNNRSYQYLVAANIGAVIMPWMIFYQQSAIADKKLTLRHLNAARWDTAVGALLTQSVMAAVLVAAAAVLAGRGHNHLDTVGDLSAALTQYLGKGAGRLVFSAGILGAGLVAAIVTSLALAWGLGEVTGYKHSLEYRPMEAGWFYGVYALAVMLAAGVVAAAPDLVALNLGVEVMNAFMLPIVLGFLIALAVKTLPEPFRLKGPYLWLVCSVSVFTCALGVFGGLSGLGLV